MNILVTGGLGFIGHRVVKLLQESHHVSLYDSLTTYGVVDHREMEWLHNERKKGIFGQKIIGDIRDYELLRKTFFIDRPDVVVHLASFPRAKVVDADPVMGSEVMVNALLKILAECKLNNVKRFVYVSSSMVYGDFKDQVKEDAPCYPQGTYANLKYTGELLVKDFCRNNDIEYVIVRPSAVYGPLDVEDRVVAKFLVNAIKGEPLIVKGANELLDFTYVDDIATGIALAATHPAAINNTFNMTRGVSRTLLEAARLIVSIVGSDSAIITKNKDKNFPSRGALSINKAQDLLGYTPQFDIEVGFGVYYNWILNK